MPKPSPSYDAHDPALLFQRLFGLANRETAGKSTLFMYESGLTFPQIIVLYTLTWMGPQTISALAERLRLSLGATSQLVDRLVEGELVAREEDPGDRRVRLVTIESHGKALMDRLNEVRRRELGEAFERLPVEVRDRLTEVLRDAIESLGEEAARPSPRRVRRVSEDRPQREPEAASPDDAPMDDWACW